MRTSTLRPGLLVSLKTSLIGNVDYDKTELQRDHVTEDGKRRAKWETVRTIADPVEHEAATKVRSEASALVRRVCAVSSFGLLCPESKSADLDRAIAEARKLVDAFNATAKLTRVHVYIITGRIAPTDVEAVKAINSEVRSLLETMQNGVANMDVKSIRDAANQARSLGTMLSLDASAKIQVAVEAARLTARKIVKAGEQAAQEIDGYTLDVLKQARTAFLDLDEAGEVAAPQEQGRALDLAPPVAPISSVQSADENRLIDAIDGEGWRV